MKWDPVIVIWSRLKEQLGFAKVTAGNPPFAETTRGQPSDGQVTAYRPDNREKRHEFSQHIGC